VPTENIVPISPLSLKHFPESINHSLQYPLLLLRLFKKQWCYEWIFYKEDVMAGCNQLADYNTLDLIAAVKLPFGKLTAGVQNLLNREYQSIWSQRAQMYYSALSSAATYEFMGRGRTLSLTYTINY
jgi:hypothetical protein